MVHGECLNHHLLFQNQTRILLSSPFSRVEVKQVIHIGNGLLAHPYPTTHLRPVVYHFDVYDKRQDENRRDCLAPQDRHAVISIPLSQKTIRISAL
jgi:hypothetical protein